jgi:hypothetical protein
MVKEFDRVSRMHHMSPQLVEAYGPVMEFHVDRHHMYIKSKKDPREEWVQTKYKITEEDIQLVMQGLGTRLESTSRRGCDCAGGNTKATQHTDVEMNPPGNGTEDTDQGNDMRMHQKQGQQINLHNPYLKQEGNDRTRAQGQLRKRRKRLKSHKWCFEMLYSCNHFHAMLRMKF